MTLSSVIGRELRSASRHSLTYYSRVLGVAAMLIAAFFFGADSGFMRNSGGPLFERLHLAQLCAIVIFVPLLAADCLSRERREGTLGLLFLTRLRAGEIVAAKGVAHGLRALSLWVAVLPVLMVPLLLGGVSWGQALSSALINFSVICWVLAAALLASAWTKSWGWVYPLSMILALISLLVLADLTGIVVDGPFSVTGEPGIFGVGWASILRAGDTDFMRGLPAGPFIRAIGKVAMLSLFALVLAVLLAGARTGSKWQEEPPSLFRVWWTQSFCKPVLWKSSFKRWTRRKLRRNPVGWLQLRTWSGRSIVWAWMAVIAVVETGLVSSDPTGRDTADTQEWMAWLMAASLAVSTAASFRRERETGVLELLLVSPLTERRILQGRLFGLWCQFLPAFALLFGIWNYFATFQKGASVSSVSIPFFAVSFLTVPVIGLYFSLRCRTFIAASLLAIIFGLLVPAALDCSINWLGALAGGGVPSMSSLTTFTVAAGVQILLAAASWFAIRDRLRNRAFPLERTEA